MEVVAALASSLQIVSQCGQVTMTIIKWVESVRTVDGRIDSFVGEVNTLRSTYETLHHSLRDPSMLEGARVTNRDVGGHLWTQMSQTLKDCERTMVAITNVLRKIQAQTSLLKPVVKQLRESLHAGELARLREQVIMFNSSLQLPMQMITLTLQLRQQEMTTAHQLQLNEQLASLRRGIERVERMSRGLKAPQRGTSIGGSTLVGESTADKVWFNNMEVYVETAKKFLDGASVAATTLSATSVKQRDDDSPLPPDVRRGSSFVPLTQQKINTISMYVDDLPTGSAITPLTSDAQSEVDHGPMGAEDSDDDDVDLQLLQTLLSNGLVEVDNADFAAAEDNYREALSISQSNNFGPQMACSTADIALMLGECLAKQDKFDEAISLLQPLATQHSSRSDIPQSSSASTLSQPQRNAERGQALSASHLLGDVYLRKSDLVNAEIYAVQAFKGRKKLLGESHPRTVESVMLVIDMYKAKGQNARAEAHRIFLKPAAQPVQDLRPANLSPSLLHTPSPPPVGSLPLPIDSSPRARRPTFNFSSPFKRTDRTDTPPTSIPMHRAKNLSGSSPYLVADEINQFSTSPNDTSSLHIGSDIRPMQTRKESTISGDGYVHRWGISEPAEKPPSISHQRTRSSLSRAPTLYAALSRSEMEQIFTEVSQLCEDGKTSKAAEKGLQLLQKYDPDSAILVHRTAELEKNIKKSRAKGLAGTGYGFAPLHFFCSMRYEPMVEIEILLQSGAEVQAVAYKAGYGKVDPFTALSLAVDRGHTNVVRLLMEYGASWDTDTIKAGHTFNADRDSIHPLLQASIRGYPEIVALLLDRGVKLTEDIFPRLSWHGNSLLHEACFRCDLRMVECLMKYSRQHSQSGNLGYSFIGRPGQQDVFGVTPLMYAVDMRDSSDQKLKAHKLRNRVACLKLLMEDSRSVDDVREDEVFVERPESSPNRIATDLHIQDNKGNTVFWYADESRGGDVELRSFLDEHHRRSRLIEF